MATLPSDFDNWLDYGNELSNCNEFNAAVSAFEHHLEENPPDYESLYSVGWALCMAKRYSDAVPYLRDAVVLNPNGDATEYYEMACAETLN